MSKSSDILSNSRRNVQQQILKTEAAYHFALTKIEQLEVELQQKDRELSSNFNEQIILRDRLEDSLETIKKITSHLNSVEGELRNSYTHIRNHIEFLAQENRKLHLSNDAWSERSIKLEFDVLAAQEEVKAMTAAHNLALDKIVLLELVLMEVKTESVQPR